MKQFAMNSPKSDGTTDLAEPGGTVGETIMATHETKTPRMMGIGHVALNARDPAALAFQLLKRMLTQATTGEKEAMNTLTRTESFTNIVVERDREALEVFGPSVQFLGCTSTKR